MIQHVRGKLARHLPSFSEASIPLAVVVQTALSSVFFVTLRLSSLLEAGIAVRFVWQPVDVPAQLMWLVSATVLADRSAVAYLRIRRR
ncbi:hypothetical protein [Streptomyces viridochromogenes]|uniref:hypothetical protein n=1 Tax=Streptomyces viridochromogenes TaxID=1938 RepID=UPI00055EE2FB|nr:hypothetical protein [Streptomyces viridochromogenes]